MIQKIGIQGFKSLEDVEVELGSLNVFVGANGSGKSNLLEAIGVLSAAADGKVNDQTLLQRGVRPGVPKLYKSAFPTSSKSHIYFNASTAGAQYAVSLNNPLKAPSPSWRFKTELLEEGQKKIASRGPNLKGNPNTENGLAALKMVELSPNQSAARLLRGLQGYAIYSPSTSVLRGVAAEGQPRQPIGLSGGRLPEAVLELLKSREDSAHVFKVTKAALKLIDWVDRYGSAPSDSLPLSPSASVSAQVVRFRDRYMKPGRNILSGYDASEGALYVLFLAVLAAHSQAPSFIAIDNADHGLNPALATSLVRSFSEWIVGNPRHPQVLMTSHNPAVLDGLPLQDDRVRLFTVDRDDVGRTVVRRVEITPQLLKLSSERDWPLSRLWMNRLIGGMPSV